AELGRRLEERMRGHVEVVKCEGKKLRKTDTMGAVAHAIQSSAWGDIGVSVSPTKSPNQQRAELIQRAREFVEGQESEYYLDFVVNTEKRTIVALIKLSTGSVMTRGIAKCMPTDVFNDWIGKAIALCKALEIEIPKEFVEAVQPTEIVKGMIAEPTEEELPHFNPSGRMPLEVTSVGENGFVWRSNGRNADKEDFNIIDDSNANYGEGN